MQSRSSFQFLFRTKMHQTSMHLCSFSHFYNMFCSLSTVQVIQTSIHFYVFKSLSNTKIQQSRLFSPSTLSRSSKFWLLFIFQVPSKLGIFSCGVVIVCQPAPPFSRRLAPLLPFFWLPLSLPTLCSLPPSHPHSRPNPLHTSACSPTINHSHTFFMLYSFS